MLFPYVPVAHQIERMHDFIEYIFFEVWCKAPGVGYSLDLFIPEPDLHAILENLERHELSGKPLAGAEFFLKGINAIFIEFKGMNPGQIFRLQEAFRQNNDIERCCTGDASCVPVTYTTLMGSYPQLTEKFRDFFKQLYSSSFLGLAIISKYIGTVGHYYSEFVKRNDQGVCPFCGIQPTDGLGDPTREALDHYLPKSQYPFNSINLRNLPPACHKCNSQNKLAADPVYDCNQSRRKAFYPFSTVPYEIVLETNIQTSDWTRLQPKDIDIAFGPTALQQEIQTWVEIYQVDIRYAAKCCSKNGGVGWLNSVVMECANYEMSRKQMFDATVAAAKNSPWLESNFLKRSFLKGCQNAGFDFGT